ncbi:HU family DNA-binding protein [Methylobacterium sp. WL93]|uniref:HU family DNA-binding protein n=1 Tax=unclassified Methylobacterium TaxID=2615210 RepID=UPI0032B10DA9
MIRSAPALRVAALNPHLYEKDCVALVDAILGRISDALAAGDRVGIRGFGSFTVKEQRARQGRNPGRKHGSRCQPKLRLPSKPGRTCGIG